MKKVLISVVCVIVCLVCLWIGAQIARRGNTPRLTLENMLVPTSPGVLPVYNQWTEKFGDKMETRIIFNIKLLQTMVQGQQQQILLLKGDPNGNESQKEDVQEDVQKDRPKKRGWF